MATGFWLQVSDFSNNNLIRRIVDLALTMTERTNFRTGKNHIQKGQYILAQG